MKTAQTLKKKVFAVDATITNDSTASATITFTETGTIYAVKWVGDVWHKNEVGGVQQYIVSLQHHRGGVGPSALRTLSLSGQQTMSMLMIDSGIVRSDTIDHLVSHTDEKYRWRRKVDEGMTVVLMMENHNLQGTTGSIGVTGYLEVWVRVR